jgi:hypothetical protein
VVLSKTLPSSMRIQVEVLLGLFALSSKTRAPRAQVP